MWSINNTQRLSIRKQKLPKSNQMDILKLKSTITKIKIDWPNSIFEMAKKEALNSKMYQFHLSNLKTEKKKI